MSPLEPPQPVSQLEQPSAQAHVAVERGPALRALVQEAPPEFRCALDGQLMMDPVQSPTGHVFERAVLARTLRESSHGCCPISGQPLALEDCQRLPDLRKKISR